MYAIAGLGNPEDRYKGTRHNVGFEFINKLAYDQNIKMKSKRRLLAFVGEGSLNGRAVVLIKPDTYMNLSGEAVQKILRFYKIPAENFLVAYDDASLPLGMVRVRQKGSAGGHNGIKNIILNLNTDEFLRIKIGIGERRTHQDLADFVLSGFNKNEKELITEGITKATDFVQLMFKENLDAAMNMYSK